jgi:hypothetical protein
MRRRLRRAFGLRSVMLVFPCSFALEPVLSRRHIGFDMPLLIIGGVCLEL